MDGPARGDQPPVFLGVGNRRQEAPLRVPQDFFILLEERIGHSERAEVLLGDIYQTDDDLPL